MPGFTIHTIGPAQTHELRHRVLRPHQTLAEMGYPGDGEPTTLHLGAFAIRGYPQRPVGIVTLSIESLLADPRPGDYRLRGMAVEAGWQGRGVGGELVRVGLEGVRQAGGRRIWCNARLTARAFYERCGFLCVGLPFEIEGIGTHVRMTRDLDGPSTVG